MSPVLLLGIAVVVLPAWFPFLVALRRGKRGLAGWIVALWAVVVAASLPVLEHELPGACARFFPGALAFAEEMLQWVQSGVGCESDTSCFLGQRALHAGLLVAGTWATGGLLSFAFAVVLFGWMGAYAGALGAASGQPLLAALLVWHPWALLRVTAYGALGVAFAEPLARRGLITRPFASRLFLLGTVGLFADLLIQALFARTWQKLLARLLFP